MYIRLYGRLGRVTKVLENGWIRCKEQGYLNSKLMRIVEDRGIKLSHDIIDLIEVCDLVNGEIVYKLDNINKIIFTYSNSLNSTLYLFNTYKKEDIKSIVTHEQLKSCEYRIEVIG